MRVTCGLCEPECVDSPDSQETNISTFNTSFDPTVISMKFMSLVQHDLSAIWSDLSQSFPLLWASDLFSKEQIGILSSIQKDIRLNIFQYILGLDERWSLEDTISISRFTMTCLVWMKMVEGLAHWDTKFKPSQHINLVSSYFKTLMVIYLEKLSNKFLRERITLVSFLVLWFVKIHLSPCSRWGEWWSMSVLTGPHTYLRFSPTLLRSKWQKKFVKRARKIEKKKALHRCQSFDSHIWAALGWRSHTNGSGESQSYNSWREGRRCQTWIKQETCCRWWIVNNFRIEEEKHKTWYNWKESNTFFNNTHPPIYLGWKNPSSFIFHILES